MAVMCPTWLRKAKGLEIANKSFDVLCGCKHARSLVNSGSHASKRVCEREGNSYLQHRNVRFSGRLRNRSTGRRFCFTRWLGRPFTLLPCAINNDYHEVQNDQTTHDVLTASGFGLLQPKR